MKRLLCGLLTLVLGTLLLAGCAKILPEQTIVCDELSITLPGNFLDMSDEEFAQEFEMVYGITNLAVCVIKEPVADLISIFPDMNAEEYAQLAVDTYGLDATVEVIDGIPSFTYEAQASEMEFTYLVGIFKSETNFWMVQCYCNRAEYAQKQSQMWEYITSVKIG